MLHNKKLKSYSKERRDNISRGMVKVWAEMTQERKVERMLPMMEASQTLIARQKSAESCHRNYVNSPQKKLERSRINSESSYKVWGKRTERERLEYMLLTIKAAQER